MPRRKLWKYQQAGQDPHVFEPVETQFAEIRGKWANFFGNDNLIILEIGCGYAEYTTGLAEINENKNFIGLDIKGDRIWKGLQKVKQKKLKNVAFVRSLAEHLDKYFCENELKEIWITFPDPRPKNSELKKRLTSTRFLEIYKKILQPKGIINLKTDNLDLFNFSLQSFKHSKLEIIEKTTDLYNSDLTKFTGGIKTRYEKQFLPKAQTIKFLRAINT